MKKMGLVGGVGWRSTMDYYRIINEEVARLFGGLRSARLALESLDLAEVRAHVDAGEEEALVSMYADAACRLAASGAEVLALCSNAAHVRITHLRKAVDVPFVHIADSIIAAARNEGYHSVGLLGTRETMEGTFLSNALRASGLAVLMPGLAEREWLHETIFGVLEQGLQTKAHRVELSKIITRLADAGADAAVLACTELPLLTGNTKMSIACLDSTRLHAVALVQAALQTTNS